MCKPGQRDLVFQLAKARKQTAAQLLDDLLTMATMPEDQLLQRLQSAGPAEPKHAEQPEAEHADEVVHAQEIDE